MSVIGGVEYVGVDVVRCLLNAGVLIIGDDDQLHCVEVLND